MGGFQAQYRNDDSVYHPHMDTYHQITTALLPTGWYDTALYAIGYLLGTITTRQHLTNSQGIPHDHFR